jgi:hypothetical protein
MWLAASRPSPEVPPVITMVVMWRPPLMAGWRHTIE